MQSLVSGKQLRVLETLSSDYRGKGALDTLIPLKKNKNFISQSKLLPTIHSASNASIKPIKSSFNLRNSRQHEPSPSDVNIHMDHKAKSRKMD